MPSLTPYRRGKTRSIQRQRLILSPLAGDVDSPLCRNTAKQIDHISIDTFPQNIFSQPVCGGHYDPHIHAFCDLMQKCERIHVPQRRKHRNPQPLTENGDAGTLILRLNCTRDHSFDWQSGKSLRQILQRFRSSPSAAA